MKTRGRCFSLSAALLAVALLAASCRDKPKYLPDPAGEPEYPAAGDESKTAADEAGGGETAEEAASQWAPLPLGRPSPLLKQPKGVPALYRKGAIALKKGELEKAMENLDAALEEDPFYENALWKRARLHMKQEQREETLAVLERLLALNYVRYASLILKNQWLKDLRKNDELWKPFEEKMEAYRKVWSEAFTGPGAFFIQGRYHKVEQTDFSGEPADLRFVRGVAMFWSKNVKRFLTIGGNYEAAGFLFDREHNKLILVTWDSHPDAKPGALGKISTSCLDLAEVKSVGRRVALTEEAEAVRLALNKEGVLLVEVVPIEETPSDSESIAKAVEKAAEEGEDSGDLKGAEAESAESKEDQKEEEEKAKEGDSGETGEETEEETLVKRIDWEKGELVDAEAADEQEWLLVLTLGSTSGPPSGSVEEVEEAPPKAKRGGACAWIDESSAVCFVPTKKGGRWHEIELREKGGETVKLTEERIPIVQY